MAATVSVALFARYAFPPNELGYCGPPDASILLRPDTDTRILRHAEGFAGAWPYLEEIAATCGLNPLDSDVVRSYWVGGPLLDRVDTRLMVSRIRHAMTGQPTGFLDCLEDDAGVLPHHSFHVMVVYPWIRFLDSGPETPLRILQACRIRWGVVSSVDDEHAVIESAPLLFDGDSLSLGDARPESVRWCRAGTALAPRPQPGQTVAAHWDWVCGPLDEAERGALAAATEATLTLVNRISAQRRGAQLSATRASPGARTAGDRPRR
jgi:hypothetical protein